MSYARELIGQVVGNLLTNAAKYSDSQAVISVRAVREAARATVTIADSGIGIEPEMLERVFKCSVTVGRAPPPGVPFVLPHTITTI